MFDMSANTLNLSFSVYCAYLCIYRICMYVFTVYVCLSPAAGPSPFRVPSSVRPQPCLAVRRRHEWKTLEVNCEANFRFVCQRGRPGQRCEEVLNFDIA